MYWYLIFVFIILILSYPIKANLVCKINVLNLVAEMYVGIFKFKVIKLRAKIKGQFIYITKRGITYKEKFTPKNVDVDFVFKFLKELYYRVNLITLEEYTELGYKLDASKTAMSVSYADIIFKSLLAKIKNNKKLAHIFVFNSANYNEDCINLKLKAFISINLFDLIYSFIVSKIKAKGEKYERVKQGKQSEGID